MLATLLRVQGFGQRQLGENLSAAESKWLTEFKAQPDPEFTPQDEDGATYADKIAAADRELDWEDPPGELFNRIRALSPHIGARAELHGRPVTIWKARVAGGRLEPLEVQPDGKRRMTYDEFLRGLR